MIAHNLAQDLRQAVTRAPGGGTGPGSAAKQARQYFEAHRFTDLAKALKTLAPGNDKPNEKLCKNWNERIVKPYDKLVKDLHTAFYMPLSHSRGALVHATKTNLYMLDAEHPEVTDTILFKKDEKKKDDKKTAKAPTPAKVKKPAESEADEAAGEKINLAEVRDTFKAIKVYYDNINKGCQGVSTVKPAAKKAADEDEDKEKDADAADDNDNS